MGLGGKAGWCCFCRPLVGGPAPKSSRVTVEYPGTRNRRLGLIPTTALRIATSRYPSNPSTQYCGNYQRRKYHVSSVLGKAHQLWSCPKPRFAARGGSRWSSARSAWQLGTVRTEWRPTRAGCRSLRGAHCCIEAQCGAVVVMQGRSARQSGAEVDRSVHGFQKSDASAFYSSRC